MRRFPTPLAVIALLALATGLAACGSGSDLGGLPADAAPTSSTPPFEPAPPPAAWADDGCAGCHGADGSGGAGGPNIQCVSFERLDAHVRTITTSHTGGAFPTLTDTELLDMVEFLRTADCPGGLPGDPSTGVPATHTESEDGVLHHPDYETNLATCTACHGANLEGSAFAPSCTSCHGRDEFEDDDD